MIEAGALGTNRDIHMGNPVDLERRRVVGDMGLRETLLAGAAALQAVWLVFVFTQLPFALRLTLAALIALVLLTVALVRPHNLTIEQHLINFVQYQRRPKHRVHLTSERDRLRLVQQGDVIADDAVVPTQTRAASHRRSLHLDWGWDMPDPTLVLAVFLGLLIVGSVIAYLGQGGSLPTTLPNWHNP